MALFNKQKKSEDVSPQDLAKQIGAIGAKLKDTIQELEKLREDTQGAITKIGITRFNPFAEIGGDQSFAIALLDGSNNGVVITSYYGREMNRIYAKHVVKGKSESSLAKEESEAIAQAMGQ